jgi:hypothetical protein
MSIVLGLFRYLYLGILLLFLYRLSRLVAADLRA